MTVELLPIAIKIEKAVFADQDAGEYARVFGDIDTNKAKAMTQSENKVLAEMDKAEHRLDDRVTTGKEFKGAASNWLPERAKVHEEIVREILSEEQIAAVTPVARSGRCRS